MAELIPPGERRELRAVVRQQIKVLRAEVKQRKAELVSEAERQLVERYREDDVKANALSTALSELTQKANTELRDLLKEHDAGVGRYRQSAYNGWFTTPSVTRTGDDRTQLHKALMAGIESQVQDAQLTLDRQEADLLRSLASEGVTTEAGRGFLDSIPTVAELVPSRRLKEIEAQFDSRAGGSK